MNKVILIGNIATDINMQYTKNGNAVASFNIAINERNGEATFIPVETWRKQAENVAQFCGKGSKVSVEGSIKIDKWEKDGQKRSFTKVNAFSIQFLDSKNDSQGQKQESQLEQKSAFADAGELVDINDDDLPF